MCKTTKGFRKILTVFILSFLFALPALGQVGQQDDWGTADTESLEEGQSEERGHSSRLSFELHGLLSLPLLGDAGSGTGAPTYADAFGVGSGGNLKVSLALVPALAIRLDMGSVVYPGKRFDSMGTENLFSDMKTAHILLGIDLYLPFGLASDEWFGSEKTVSFTGFALHLSLQGGIQYVDHIRWIEPLPSWSYWDSSIGGMLAFDLGFDYRLSSAFGFSVDLECLYSGPSPMADHSGTRASAEGMLAFGVTAGISLRF